MVKPNSDSLPHSIFGEAMTRLPLSLVLTDPRQPDNPIVYVNSAFTETTGYSYDEVVGHNCRFLQGDETSASDVQAIREALAAGREITRDIVNYRANGERFLNRLIITPIVGELSGKIEYFLGIQLELEAYATYIERVAELDERLREIQHRVKNHLSVIVSLIRLQAKSLGAKEAAELLANRVEAISLLYDQLAADEENSGQQMVPLGAYVTRVCSAMQSLSDRTAVRVNVDAAGIAYPLEKAARLGLILSEVLTNALQHAFDADQAGEIRVELVDGDDSFDLIVADNGRGLGNSKWPDRESLGGRIVLDLISRLNGELEVESKGTGTSVRIRFACSVSQRGGKKNGTPPLDPTPPPPG